MLRVQLLGHVMVEADGELRTLPAGRSCSLLGWLALNRGMHSRTALASRFWPDVLESSARASLRSALWSLRGALGAGADRWLITTRDAVGLADGVTTDLAEFRAYAESGDLERAAEAAAGELLAGVGDDWVFEARDQHSRELGRVLASLVARARELGRPEAAVAWAQRRVALEPLSEAATRDLMRALADAGDRSAALAAYTMLRDRFRLELAISPSEETRTVRDEIRAAPRPPEEGGPPAGPYPLTGRDREMADVITAWRAARRGRGSVVVVSGEAGIGKTRLALELAGRAHREGGRIATCAAVDLGGAPPFGLWAELLHDLTRGLAEPPEDAAWPAELARLAPELARRLGRAPSPTAGSPELERARLFEAIVEMVEWAAHDRPLLLLLEDVHIADRASLELAGYLGRSTRRLPLLLVLTRRDLPRRPELDMLLARLRAHGALGLDVALPPLHDAAVAQLARAAAELDEDEVERVVELADGNALLATEAARARARSGRHLPESLREAARAALATLDEDAMRLAALAAVAGRNLERDEVERLPLADRGASATEAFDSGLLVSSGSRIGYRHALLRDAVYADLPEPRRAELHEQIAHVLSGSASASAAEVARHLRLAGRDAEAVQHLAQAARDARRVGALDEAAGFLEEALCFAPRDSGLLLELGEVEAWRSRTGPSRAAFDRALASIPASDTAAQAQAWIRRGRSFRGALCFPRESQAAYREALAVLDAAGSDDRAEAHAGLAWAEAVAGDVELVDPLLRELHALVGRAQPDSRLTLDIGLARGHALIRAGRFSESYPPLIAAAEAGRAAGRPDLSYTCWINASSAAACAREFERSLEFANRCRAWMRQAGLLSLEANALSARTHILIRLNRLTEALASADQACELAERLDSGPLRATAAHDRGMAERARGNHADAERMLAQAIAGNAAVSRPLARLARAESLARLGRAEDAEEELRLTALEPVGPGDFPDTLVARLTYVQGLIAATRDDTGLARRRLTEAIAVWRRRTGRAREGDDYMEVMVDLGRPPVAGLIEPQHELARLEAELEALSSEKVA